MDLPTQANAPDLDQEFVHLGSRRRIGSLVMLRCSQMKLGRSFPLVPDLTWRISEGHMGA